MTAPAPPVCSAKQAKVWPKAKWTAKEKESVAESALVGLAGFLVAVLGKEEYKCQQGKGPAVGGTIPCPGFGLPDNPTQVSFTTLSFWSTSQHALPCHLGSKQPVFYRFIRCLAVVDGRRCAARVQSCCAETIGCPSAIAPSGGIRDRIERS